MPLNESSTIKGVRKRLKLYQWIMYSGGSAGRGENHFLSSSRTVTAVMAVCNVELIKVTNTGGTKKNIRGTKKNTQVTETGGTKKNTQGTGCVRLYQLGQLLILLV